MVAYAFMTPALDQDSFMFWASDHMVYGPVDLATLTQWVTEERVFPKTWVLSRNHNCWAQAETLEPLGQFFVNNSIASATRSGPNDVDDGVIEELRQFSAFTGLSNVQLEQFVRFGELAEARLRGRRQRHAHN